MSDTSFASLNPALLARKGGAKPAMRPQLGPIPSANAANLDDLGWNDMGQEEVAQAGATILQLDLPQSEQPPKTSGAKRKARAIKPKTAANNANGKRAAFTLRLDMERHLKLRLASTMMNRSAQQIVTEALDALLDEIEDLESLAAKMQRS